MNNEFKECISYNLGLLELQKTRLINAMEVVITREELHSLDKELSQVERLIKYNDHLLHERTGLK